MVRGGATIEALTAGRIAGQVRGLIRERGLADDARFERAGPRAAPTASSSAVTTRQGFWRATTAGGAPGGAHAGLTRLTCHAVHELVHLARARPARDRVKTPSRTRPRRCAERSSTRLERGRSTLVTYRGSRRCDRSRDLTRGRARDARSTSECHRPLRRAARADELDRRALPDRSARLRATPSHATLLRRPTDSTGPGSRPAMTPRDPHGRRTRPHAPGDPSRERPDGNIAGPMEPPIEWERSPSAQPGPLGRAGGAARPGRVLRHRGAGRRA